MINNTTFKMNLFAFFFSFAKPEGPYYGFAIFFNILPMDFLKVMSLHGGAIQRKFLPSSVDREKKGGSVKSSRTKTMHEK
jgi:hypothetical protein